MQDRYIINNYINTHKLLSLNEKICCCQLYRAYTILATLHFLVIFVGSLFIMSLFIFLCASGNLQYMHLLLFGTFSIRYKLVFTSENCALLIIV